jgi:hypothetical protein
VQQFQEASNSTYDILESGSEGTIQQRQDYIKPDVPSLQTDETMSHPLVSYNNIVVVKEIFAQKTHHHFQGFIVSPDCNKTSDVHVLFQGNQVDYGLTNTTEIAGEQFGFFHQLEFCHIIYDPVVVYMESVFP